VPLACSRTCSVVHVVKSVFEKSGEATFERIYNRPMGERIVLDKPTCRTSHLKNYAISEWRMLVV
jgi:hypothetical protein